MSLFNEPTRKSANSPDRSVHVTDGHYMNDFLRGFRHERRQVFHVDAGIRSFLQLQSPLLTFTIKQISDLFLE